MTNWTPPYPDEQENEKGSSGQDLTNSILKNPRVEISKKGFKKKEFTGLDKYLIFTFVSLILFTIAILIIFVITHEEPAVLVGCFFAAFASEVYHCAKIKKLKLHKETELMNKNDNDTFT